MLDQFLAPENIVFSAALLLMLLIGAVQAIGLAGDIDADLHGDTDGDIGVADTLLAWAGIGRVPFLMWLVLFLALFGALGLGLQHLMTALTGGPGPGRSRQSRSADHGALAQRASAIPPARASPTRTASHTRSWSNPTAPTRFSRPERACCS